MPPSEVEKRKLLAGALDRASTACITAGVIAPVAAATFVPQEPVMPLVLYGTAVLCWLSAGIALHLLGRFVLGGLDYE